MIDHPEMKHYTLHIKDPEGKLLFVGTLPGDCITSHHQGHVHYVTLSRIPTPVHDMFAQLRHAQYPPSDPSVYHPPTTDKGTSAQD